MTMDRVFVDANVLFSFAYGSAGLSRLLDRARKRQCLLLASQYVVEEARRNLSDPEQIRNLEVFLSEVEIVPEVDPHIPSPVDLPEKDRPVIMAAISAKADYFLTGDTTHFGKYFGKSVTGIKILRPREYFDIRPPK